jgi:hypothetical protein
MDWVHLAKDRNWWLTVVNSKPVPKTTETNKNEKVSRCVVCSFAYTIGLEDDLLQIETSTYDNKYTVCKSTKKIIPLHRWYETRGPEFNMKNKKIQILVGVYTNS